MFAIYEKVPAHARNILTGQARKIRNGEVRYLTMGNKKQGREKFWRNAVRETNIISWNHRAPDTMEECARLGGWLRAVVEDPRCWRVKDLLDRYTTNRGVNSPWTKLNPEELFYAIPSPSNLAHTEYLGYSRLFEILDWNGNDFIVPSKRAASVLGRLSKPAIMAGFRQPMVDRKVYRLDEFMDLGKVHKLQGKTRMMLKEGYGKPQTHIAAGKMAWGLAGLRAKGVYLADVCFPFAKGFSSVVLMKLLNKVVSSDISTLHEMFKLDLIFPAIHIARLFGNEARCNAWLQKFHSTYPERVWDPISLIHEAGQLNIGSDPLWEPNKSWGDLLLKAPSLYRLAGLFQSLEEEGYLPSSKEEFEEAVAKLSKDSPFALAMKYGANVQQYRWFFTNVKNKERSTVPPPCNAEKGDYSIRQLQKDDPMQVYAGLATDCCQHLNGAGAPCAEAAWTQPHAAIWSVERKGEMVAQSFVWMAKDGSLVIDSVEAKGATRAETVLPLYAEAISDVINSGKVSRVLIGKTSYGLTKEIGHALKGKVVETPDCMFKLTYSDARHGCYEVAVGKAEVLMPKVTKVEEPAVGCFDVLAENTDVYCEYCEAEVHPLAENCPACGEYIGEWVDEEEEDAA